MIQEKVLGETDVSHYLYFYLIKIKFIHSYFQIDQLLLMG